ncbi:MAG TPA: molecular chaperone DnaJ [Alphaproteobacteria bacterium]|nr:molecular chaperone DnaJ [Alphaproteobacteria bacterium]
MAKQDYYATLGLARGAAIEDIKKAYRKLAMQYHPDRNPGDDAAEHRFKEINEAYDVLKDDQKRAAYDRFGHAAFENGGARPNGFDFSFSGGFADIFDEMFGDFMGGRRGGAAQSARGADLRYNLEITLEEAFSGKQAKVRVPTLLPCEECGGLGSAKGAGRRSCGTCNGMGRVRATQGFFTIERSCPTCQGAGEVIDKPCRSCEGAGRVRKERALSVTIPSGVEDGTRIRLAGEGEAGLRGAPAGDLYIFLSIAPHAIFQRDGAHIYCKVPIEMIAAALGGVVEVPTVEGSRARLTIPPGTQTGAQFRLKGKGMTVLRSSARGDMFVQAQIETPVNLTRRQQELLREFEKAGQGQSHSPESEGFFARVKELWQELKD